jgi:hypothetical protein
MGLAIGHLINSYSVPVSDGELTCGSHASPNTIFAWKLLFTKHYICMETTLLVDGRPVDQVGPIFLDFSH